MSRMSLCLLAATLWIGACGRFAAEDVPGDAGAAGDAGGIGVGDAADDVDGGTCSAGCPDAGVCHDYTFDAANCPPSDWSVGGDPTSARAFHECASGALHVHAEGTLDVTAYVSLGTPSNPYSVHVSARVTVDAWDGGRVLRLLLGSSEVVTIGAATPTPNEVTFLACRGGSCAAFAQVPAGSEHVFVIDVRSTGVTLTMDCAIVGNPPAVPIPTKSSLSLEFGKTDGNPIDGTLAEATIAFGPP
jgi:hypothetical protein